MSDDTQFKTKLQLAAEMLLDLDDQKQLPFRYILADSVFGTSPEFIEAAESLVGITYMLQVPEDTLCWLKQPVIVDKTYKFRGKKKKKKILSDTAKGINNFFWYRRKVSEGTKGPIEYEFTKRRIVLSHDGLPQKTVWVIIRRTLGEEPGYSFYISNAPVSSRLSLFVWLSGLRWSIEQCFKETKTELGMNQYEVRKFPGWNHHILTCMLGHYFLWHLKIRLGKKAPAITPAQLRILLKTVLPLRVFDGLNGFSNVTTVPTYLTEKSNW